MVTQLEPASYMAHEQACYTFQPRVSQQRFKKREREKSSISTQSDLCTSLLLLLSVWVSTLLTHLLLNVEPQGKFVEVQSGLGHRCPKFHTWGTSLHVCANDWPWRSRVAVACRRTVAGERCLCDCVYLGPERLCRHCIVPLSEDSSCISNRNKNPLFSRKGSHMNFSQLFFCEAHQLCFYLGQTEIRFKRSYT